MSRAFVNAHCAGLPGAEHSDPWGGGHDYGVAVKCRDVETAELLVEVGRAERAPYFHRSWVRIPWGRVEDAELAERLDASYALIRAKLPKKVRDALGRGDG